LSPIRCPLSSSTLRTTKAPGAKRLGQIPPYLFAEIDRKVQEKKRAGIDVISLGIGDPDLPTPKRVVSVLQEAAADPENHRYPSYFGLAELRGAIANWYSDRFGARLDPSTEILPTLGSKDGISHVPLALVDPGDVVLAPDPGYTVYVTGALMAGAEPYAMPLTAGNGWLPDLDAIPAEVADRARLMWLNYPNNPTAAVADREFLERAVAFCRDHGIILCHDAPYSEIAFDGYRPLSLFEIDGAKDVGLEFHSLSKTFNMTGWRIGWVCGRADLVGLIGQPAAASLFLLPVDFGAGFPKLRFVLFGLAIRCRQAGFRRPPSARRQLLPLLQHLPQRPKQHGAEKEVKEHQKDRGGDTFD